MLSSAAVLIAGSLAIVLVAGYLIIPLLQRLQLRQHAYEDAPATHQVKTGTPTMGGIVFLIPLALIALTGGDRLGFAMIFLVLACGVVGFIDDIMGITQGRNRGLTARTKFLATALVAIVYLRWIYGTYLLFPRDVIFTAGSYAMTVPHWLWLVLGIFAVTGTIHAVNLTDGLDGLATGTIIPPLIVFAFIGYGMHLLTPVAAALVGTGSCIGFLVYNRHPAKMFMGDTGSLALGALLSGIAILEGEMLLLVVVGGVFVAEALSVIVQVGYFKATRGKRVLRMSPLHHHFELGGWPETKVTTRFWAASLVLSAVGWLLVR